MNFKKLVEAGSDQNIRVKITDLGSGDPVSSAIVRITIYFPGGTPIRQFSLLTSKNGDASLTLPIDKNAPLGQYGIDVLASALGYYDSAVGTLAFAVNSQVDQNVDLHVINIRATPSRITMDIITTTTTTTSHCPY